MGRVFKKLQKAHIRRFQLKVLDSVTRVVHRIGFWFASEVKRCPENDLDGLLWPLFMIHAKLTTIHAFLTRGWFGYWSIKSERLTHLWRYYWCFQTNEYRQKSKEVIHVVTQKYKEKMV